MQNRLFWRWTENVDLQIPDNIGPLAAGEENYEMEDEDKESIRPVDAVDIARHLLS